MSARSVKALTFDTRGTVLDWHTGFSKAFAAAGGTAWKPSKGPT